MKSSIKSAGLIEVLKTRKVSLSAFEFRVSPRIFLVCVKLFDKKQEDLLSTFGTNRKFIECYNPKLTLNNMHEKEK
ncbi:MAG: hypothetical protein M3Z92_08050 [Bacteroidota bacterium]|nr:hypothetical protein [Bacteroidota bacterium]